MFGRDAVPNSGDTDEVDKFRFGLVFLTYKTWIKQSSYGGDTSTRESEQRKIR